MFLGFDDDRSDDNILIQRQAMEHDAPTAHGARWLKQSWGPILRRARRRLRSAQKTERERNGPYGSGRLQWIGLVIVAAISAPASAMAAQRLRLPNDDKAGYSNLYAAECLVRQNRPLLEKLILLPPFSLASTRSFSVLMREPCFQRGGTLIIGPRFQRPSFYYALYRADYGRRPGGISAGPINFLDDILGAPRAAGGAYLALRNFTDCVVRAAPEDARSLVTAGLGSADEEAAFKKLSTKFDACLYVGQTLDFSRGILIGLVAEALYREAKAASGSTISGGKE
jgi:hypothetical protein